VFLEGLVLHLQLVLLLLGLDLQLLVLLFGVLGVLDAEEVGFLQVVEEFNHLVWLPEVHLFVIDGFL